jgi:hypothetical protein
VKTPSKKKKTEKVRENQRTLMRSVLFKYPDAALALLRQSTGKKRLLRVAKMAILSKLMHKNMIRRRHIHLPCQFSGHRVLRLAISEHHCPEERGWKEPASRVVTGICSKSKATKE